MKPALTLSLLTALLLAPLVTLHAADTIRLMDCFDDGTLGARWDADNLPMNQSGELDDLTVGKPPTPGRLTIRSKELKDSYNQITFILRDDATLDEVGDFAEVDVQILQGVGNANVTPGLALATKPHGILRDRSNSLMFTQRGDGMMRVNAYSLAGTDLYELGLENAGVKAGEAATLRILRSGPTHYQLWAGPAGNPVHYVGTADFAHQEFPAVPGLMVGNGTVDFVVQFDNFKVGHTPTIEAKPTPKPPPAPIPAEEQVTLSLPKDVMSLPRVASQRYVVHKPLNAKEMTCHHGAIVTPWKDRLYVAWHATQRGEDTPPYVGMIASAPLNDLSRFGKAAPVTHLDTRNYERYMRQRYKLPENQELIVNSAPRTLHATPDKLYLFTLGNVSSKRTYLHAQKFDSGRIFWTSDGETWNEIPQEELDKMVGTQGLDGMRDSSSNHDFVTLRDGRLMATALGRGGLWCPLTTDTTGLSGWQGTAIDCSDCDDVGEPGGWEGPDGVLHVTARNGGRIWHSFSRDGGKTWSKLAMQPSFPDSPGNKDFDVLPDGSVLYVGTPIVGTRDQLVVSTSRNGWHFDNTWLLRWEPSIVTYPAPFKCKSGYSYPDAAVAGDRVFLAYSVARDYVEVSEIKLTDLKLHLVPVKAR